MKLVLVEINGTFYILMHTDILQRSLIHFCIYFCAFLVLICTVKFNILKIKFNFEK